MLDRDFQTAFSGRHDNSVLGVLQRDYDAAAVANIVIDQVLARGVGSRDDLRVLYRSETFPTTAYGVSNRLDPDLTEAVIEAFYTFDWEGSALDAEFGENRRTHSEPRSSHLGPDHEPHHRRSAWSGVSPR